jgi:hypothetical protein
LLDCPQRADWLLSNHRSCLPGTIISFPATVPGFMAVLAGLSQKAAQA